MKVSVANAQSRSMTYSIVETTTRETGVASRTMMPALRRNDAAPTLASDSSRPTGQARGARDHAGAQHDPDHPLEARRLLRRPRGAHRPPRMNIIAETMKRTAAIRIFSHFADAAAPNFMPPHEPSCTPRTAAAASAGSSWPWP